METATTTTTNYVSVGLNQAACDSVTYATSTGSVYTVNVPGDYYTITTSPTYTYTYSGSNQSTEKSPKKEDKKMDGMKFGPVTNDSIRLSMYGIAVKTKDGKWVSFDTAKHKIIDVTDFVFSNKKILYYMPVAIKDIAIGNAIMQNGSVYYVIEAPEATGVINCLDIATGEYKKIMLTTNMYGFDYVTKIVSITDLCPCEPSADQPFGNMLPLMMMGDNDKIDPMIFMLMNQNGNFDMNNPMLLYALSSGNKDLLPLLFMMNQKKTDK